MNRKVFKASNIQEAIASIKAEMGTDAMILNTRKIPKKPLDPYAKQMFEVEAAVPANTGPSLNRTWKSDTRVEKQVKPNANRSFGGGNPGHASAAVPEKNVMDTIRTDIADIKDMISLAGFGSGMKNMVCNHFESVGVLASLLRAGVSESLTTRLVEKACLSMDETKDKETSIKSLKKFVMRQCLAQIDTRDFFKPDDQSNVPQMAAFIGPTGVGKTTTIAKLAANLTFSKKMKVGLVSIDNYRIGAFEQLKTYASIMGLPCLPAFNSEDLVHALDRMKTMDIVLIDTAGHSHLDKPKLDEILTLIKTDFRISTHLVLSVTTESTIIKDAASAFSVFNPDTLIFTKIDESRQCGKVLDQISDMRLPVSLIANGQRVPEDLIFPDKQQLLKIILGTRA